MYEQLADILPKVLRIRTAAQHFFNLQHPYTTP